jgi:hypothetical protein
VTNQPRFGPQSAFASCPAATGEADPTEQCGTYPDGAHRCRRERHSLDRHARHICLCGYDWVCLTATNLSDPEVDAVLHPARHAA